MRGGQRLPIGCMCVYFAFLVSVCVRVWVDGWVVVGWLADGDLGASFSLQGCLEMWVDILDKNDTGKNLPYQIAQARPVAFVRHRAHHCCWH